MVPTSTITGTSPAQSTSSVTSAYESEIRWILIAEDDDDIRQLLRESLEREAEELPIRIVEAKNGAEAIEKSNKRQFHCVITDLNMPKQNGEEFIRNLQAQPLNASTPALIVSAHTRDEFREFCESYSHIRMIPKPCEPRVVAQAALREIKLGRLDDRASVHLINPFMDSVRELLQKELELSSETLKPAIKKASEKLLGDVHCSMIVTTGTTRARFSLSFDKSLLDAVKGNAQLRLRILQLGSATTENVARFFVQTVFDMAYKSIQNCMGGLPRLGSLSIIVSRESNEYLDLLNTTGVMLVLRTDHGRICAGALTPPKASAKSRAI